MKQVINNVQNYQMRSKLGFYVEFGPKLFAYFELTS